MQRYLCSESADILSNLINFYSVIRGIPKHPGQPQKFESLLSFKLQI